VTIQRVVHHRHALGDAVRDDRARGDDPVGVDHLDPVVVLDADAIAILWAHPQHRPAAKQRQHLQVVLVGRVDRPLRVRGDVAQRDAGLAGIQRTVKVHRRPVERDPLAVVEHPGVVEVQVLATGERAPGDRTLDVHRERRVAAITALDPRPFR
jgi:hypothetical protein